MKRDLSDTLIVFDSAKNFMKGKDRDKNKDVSELTIEELRSSNDNLSKISNEVISYLDLRNSMNARDSFGGTSTKQTIKQIEIFENWLKGK